MILLSQPIFATEQMHWFLARRSQILSLAFEKQIEDFDEACERALGEIETCSLSPDHKLAVLTAIVKGVSLFDQPTTSHLERAEKCIITAHNALSEFSGHTTSRKILRKVQLNDCKILLVMRSPKPDYDRASELILEARADLPVQEIGDYGRKLQQYEEKIKYLKNK